MAQCLRPGRPDPVGWAAHAARVRDVTFHVMTRARSLPGGQVFVGGRAALPGAMQPDLSSEQWVSQVKVRMPRQCTELDVIGTELSQIQSWPVSRRWYEAHQEEIKRWKEKKPHYMTDVLQIVRRDLACVPPMFSPARWTTMVEGRPVQAQRLNQDSN